MNRILAMVTMMFSVVIARGDVFEYNGLTYETFEDKHPITLEQEVVLSVKSCSKDIEGVVTIPRSVPYNGKELIVRGISDYAFSSCKKLSGINVPPTLTTIGSSAFRKTGIKSVDLSSTRVETICCFEDCNELIDLKLPQSTSTVYINHLGNAIKSLTLPGGAMLGLAGTTPLPPMLEDLYCLYVPSFKIVDESLLSNYDFSKITLHLPQDKIAEAIERYGDKFKAYKVWNFETVTDIEPDFSGFKTEIYNPDFYQYPAIHINVGETYRLRFKSTPENALFKQIIVYQNYPYIDIDYDGIDAVVFRLKKIDILAYRSNTPVPLFRVCPSYAPDFKNYFSQQIPVFQHLGENYPTSMGFQYPEVHIKPFEFFYQPVQLLPEGSTTPTLIWESSDPKIATVTSEGKVYPLVEEGTVTITATDGINLKASYTAIIDVNGAVNDIMADDNTKKTYYNLYGIQVDEDNLTPGVYIVRQGSVTRKVVIGNK